MLSLRTCLSLALIAACAPRPTQTETASDDTSTGDTSTGAAATSTTTEPTTGATGSSGSTTVHDIMPHDMGGSPGLCSRSGARSSECSLWEQDCPEGEKCNSYDALGSGAWDPKCVPLAPDPGQPGDPCSIEGGKFTGVDTCDVGSMCWHIDRATWTGTCVPHCQGTPDAPICPPGTLCAIIDCNDLTLCLPPCDPLLQDCPEGDVCVPDRDDPDGFVCIFDASGDDGHVFGACDHLHDCDEALACVDSKLGLECEPTMFGGCCLPFCDTTQPPTCPGALQQCLPWFATGEAPPGRENVGVCGVPR